MRKKDDCLRENLLNIACEIADKEGIEGVNIRSIAKNAGVATGTVYNYFSCKEEILLELTDGYWQTALAEMRDYVKSENFCGRLEEIFNFLRNKIQTSAGKLMNSLNGASRQTAEGKMAAAQSELAAYLTTLLKNDVEIPENIWDESFTAENLAQFIMTNLFLALKSEQNNIDFFILIIKKVLYSKKANKF